MFLFFFLSFKRFFANKQKIKNNLPVRCAINNNADRKINQLSTAPQNKTFKFFEIQNLWKNSKPKKKQIGTHRTRFNRIEEQISFRVFHVQRTVRVDCVFVAAEQRQVAYHMASGRQDEYYIHWRNVWGWYQFIFFLNLFI